MRAYILASCASCNCTIVLLVYTDIVHVYVIEHYVQVVQRSRDFRNRQDDLATNETLLFEAVISLIPASSHRDRQSAVSLYTLTRSIVYNEATSYLIRGIHFRTTVDE